MTNNEQHRKSYEKIGLIYNAILNKVSKYYVERLLQTEGDINYKISEGFDRVSNLLNTALNSSTVYFNLLLEYGVDFTDKDEEGRTVVHIAIEKRFGLESSHVQWENMSRVLDAHVKFNNPTNPSDKNGFTHFHAACISNNSLAVKFFLNNGVDVNQAVNADSPIYPSYTPIHLAVKHTCPDVVEILLKHEANVRSKNVAGLSPLHSIIKRKIEDFDVKDENFDRMFAIFAKFSINNDAIYSRDASDDFGLCKLHIACLYQDVYLIERVLGQISNINQAVNLNFPVCPGYTALHFAALSSKVEIFKLLLTNGADIEAKNARGETPFELCSQNFRDKDILSIVETIKHWKNIVLSDNETTLMDVLSLMEDYLGFEPFLDSNGSALNLIVPFDSPLWPGYTLLHLAVILTDIDALMKKYKRHRQVNDLVEICLQRGIDVLAKDAKGSTALHLAFYTKKRYTIQSILDHHDKPDSPADKDHLSHFHIACAVGHLKAVEHFLSIGVDVNSPAVISMTFESQVFHANEKLRFFICPGSTALHISVACRNVELTEMLLTHGADVNAQDANGFTPVHRLLSSSSAYKCSISKALMSVKNLKNITASCGLNHLHVACYLHNAKAIDKLLKLGADINAPLIWKCDDDVRTAASAAAEDDDDDNGSRIDSYGDLEKPLAFLSKYAGYTPLHFACMHNEKTALMLIERKANVFATDYQANFPLQTLLRRLDRSIGHEGINDTNIYFRVISKNVAIKTYLEIEYGITELHVVCRIPEIMLAERLIKHGANVNARVNSKSPIWQGYTPLHCTVDIACRIYRYSDLYKKLEEIVRVLTEYGADPLLADNNDKTPFDLCCVHVQTCINKADFLTVVPFFIHLSKGIKNVDVKTANNRGISPLHVACMTANVVMIEKVLKQGANVNQAISHFSRFCSGSAALYLVIKRYRESCDRSSKYYLSDQVLLQLVDMLIKNGANVNAVDASGNTPLHEAVRRTDLRPTLIRKLISNGADVHVKNVYCDTPFNVLLKCGDATWEEIDIFLQAGATFNVYRPTSQEGYIAIFLREIESSNINNENQLLQRMINNPKIIAIDKSGRTALHNMVSIHSYEKDKDVPFLDPFKSRLPLPGVFTSV